MHHAVLLVQNAILVCSTRLCRCSPTNNSSLGSQKTRAWSGWIMNHLFSSDSLCFDTIRKSTGNLLWGWLGFSMTRRYRLHWMASISDESIRFWLPHFAGPVFCMVDSLPNQESSMVAID